jgi:nitroreductase
MTRTSVTPQGASLTDEAYRTVSDVIAGRTSCRAYKPDPVSEGDILRILEAARLAPSACNKQPCRYAVVRDADARRRVVDEGFMPGIKMTWALNAPVLIAIGMETSFLTHRLGASVSGVEYPWIDIGIAGEHLVLAATELGLGTCWIGWIRPRAIRRIVGWPLAVKPAVVVTVGYPEDGLRPELPAARRKPLESLTTWI